MIDEKDKEKEDELEVVETDEQGKPIVLPPEDGDTAKGAAEPDDEVDEDDKATDDAGLSLEEGDDPEARRERRRLERKERKERQRLRDQQREGELRLLRQQNEQLAGRLANLETGQGQQQLAAINDRISTTKQDLQRINGMLQAAMAKNDARATVEIMNMRDQARDQLNNLTQLQLASTRQKPTTAQPAAPAPGQGGMDPTVQANVNRFTSKHRWYDVEGKNADSRVLLALDQVIADEGFDPRSQDYWDELERRAKSYLPHRFKGQVPGDGRQQGQQRGERQVSPVTGSGQRDGQRPTKQVYITPERKKAMQEAGAWDDQVKRKRMLKAFADYDRQHAGDARSN